MNTEEPESVDEHCLSEWEPSMGDVEIGWDTTWAKSRARPAPNVIRDSGTLRMAGVRSQSWRTCFESLW